MMKKLFVAINIMLFIAPIYSYAEYDVIKIKFNSQFSALRSASGPNFGIVEVGKSVTYGFNRGIGLGSLTCGSICDTPQLWTQPTSVVIKGSSDFKIARDGCTGVRLWGGTGTYWCEVEVTFAPTSKGEKTATLEFSLLGQGYIPSTGGTFLFNDFVVENLSGDGIDPVEEKLPPADSEESCQIKTHSSVNVDNLSITEDAFSAGLPFEFSYSSDRFQKGFVFSMKSLGLGGWGPNTLHHYDVTNKILYYGDGGIRPVPASATAVGFYVPSKSATEIYYFDSNGIHTKTTDAITGVTKLKFYYDGSGRISSIVDTFSNTTSFQYSGSQVSITSPYGQVTLLSLDANGFLASITNPNRESYMITHDSAGRMTSFQKPGGQRSFVTYDSNGYVVKDQGAGGDFISLIRQFDSSRGIQTVISSTALGRQTTYTTMASSSESSSRSVTSSDGSNSVFSNAAQGSSTSTDAFGSTYSATQAQDPRFGWMAPYEDSSFYRVPNSNISLFVQKNQFAQLSNATDPLSLTSLTSTATIQGDPTRVFSRSFDVKKKLWTTLSPLKRVTYATLNSSGQIGNVQNGGLIPVSFNYDSRGRLSSVIQSDRKSSMSYDNHGNISSVTDPLGRVTQFKYDNANRVTQQVLPGGQVIAMTYDANGNIRSISPPGKTAHNFSYNLFELVDSYLPPALNSMISGATNYSYNLDKQLTQINRPDGVQVKMTYDAGSGLKTKIEASNGNISYTYLPKSKLVRSIASTDGEVLSYQYAGNLLNAESTTGQVSSSLRYSYNTDGAVSAISVAGRSALPSRVAYSYDKDGLLTRAGNESFVLNGVGAISSTKLGEVEEFISYDSFGQSVSDQYRFGKRDLFRMDLTRDKLGRVSSSSEFMERDKKRLSYQYDSQGRLTKVLLWGVVPISEYKYDPNGNRIEAKTLRGPVKAEYDAQDRLVKYGRIRFEYTANGELAKKIENHRDWDDFWPWNRHHHNDDYQKVTTYSYDVFGNLKTVILPNKQKIEYVIDGQNRRVGKKINGTLVQGFVYQSQTQIAAELDGNGNLVKRFVYGSKGNSPDFMIYNNREYRIISDQVGTPRMIADVMTGVVTEILDFDEFGASRFGEMNRDKHRESSVLPFGFAGGLLDRDTGLVRFGARDYNPEVGRWTSKDPILFKGGSAGLYNYSGNDPVNFIDPSGLAPGDQFATLNDAISDALRYVHGLTKINGIEYAGQIVKNGNSYTYGDPNAGTDRSSDPGSCSNAVAAFHSHPSAVADLLPGQTFLPEMFSSADVNYARSHGIPVYLVAPSGLGSVINVTPSSFSVGKVPVF